MSQEEDIGAGQLRHFTKCRVSYRIFSLGGGGGGGDVVCGIACLMKT